MNIRRRGQDYRRQNMYQQRRNGRGYNRRNRQNYYSDRGYNRGTRRRSVWGQLARGEYYDDGYDEYDDYNESPTFTSRIVNKIAGLHKRSAKHTKPIICNNIKYDDACREEENYVRFEYGKLSTSGNRDPSSE